MKSLDQFNRPGGIAQGYVRMIARDQAGKVVYDSLLQKNTVVNDARRSAAAAFANTAGLVGLGFGVKKYRCGYSNTLALHWDNVNNRPLEAPVTETVLLAQYTGVETVDFFHTQADVSGLIADGLAWAGTGLPLIQKAIPLSVVYPFNADEYAVQLTVTLDALTSVDASFDTVEVVLSNGVKFAHRWTYPIVKQAGWSLEITHLIMF
jgi:hypothetical protein